MFSRKSLFTLLAGACAAAAFAQSPVKNSPGPVPATTTASPAAAPAAGAAASIDGGMPAWVKPETAEHRRERLGTEDPGPDPDLKKIYTRFGKQYRIERYNRRFAAFDVEEGWVRPFGYVNTTREVYQLNDKYVWAWEEIKAPLTKEETAILETPPSTFTKAQVEYLRYMRPEFQDLTVPDSGKAIRFEESSEGLPVSGSWRNSLAVGDMNGDGFMDLVVPPERGGGDAGTVPVIFLGDGKGHWKLWQNVEWPSSVQYGSAAVGDFNKDGKMDVAFGIHLTGVRAFLGDGKGHFTDASKGLPANDFPTRRIMVTDVDQDGYPDIVAISEGPTAVNKENAHGKMRVFVNRKQGTEWAGTDVTDVSKAFGGDWMAVGKFNADKYPDFAGASVYFQGSQILYRSNGKLKWDEVKSDGKLVPYLSYYFAMAAGRLRSSTPLDDLVLSYARFWPGEAATAGIPPPPITYLVGVDRISFDGAEPKRTPVMRWSGSHAVWGLAMADMDGDGKNDVIFTKYDPRETVILLGDGKGGFARAKAEGLTLAPNTNYDLKVADVNGDGRPDVILMYESAGLTRFAQQDGSIRVFLNRGPVTPSEAAKPALK